MKENRKILGLLILGSMATLTNYVWSHVIL